MYLIVQDSDYAVQSGLSVILVTSKTMLFKRGADGLSAKCVRKVMRVKSWNVVIGRGTVYVADIEPYQARSLFAQALANDVLERDTIVLDTSSAS